MRNHPYLRAYMAGVLLPSWLLLLVLAVFLTYLSKHGLRTGIVFPMAVVPNLWGVWNVLYNVPAIRRRVSIGVFGALLPLVIGPLGVLLVFGLGLDVYTWRDVALMLPIAMALYYLAWKYVVEFFNRVVGLV